MFGVGKKSLLEPEEETFVIDIEEENEGFDGDRMKRVADGGDFWATRLSQIYLSLIKPLFLWKPGLIILTVLLCLSTHNLSDVVVT